MKTPTAATEVSAAPIAATEVSAGKGGRIAHVHVVVVQGLEEQQRGDPVSPEETVAGIPQLVLVFPEPLPLVGVHEVLVRLRLRQAGFEFLELLLPLSFLA